MTLIIGTGEYAERIRRGQGVAGRVPLELSETASPVVLLEDLRRAPFRTSGVSCWGGRNFGVNAGSSTYAVNLTGSVQVVERILIYNGEPGAFEFYAGLWIAPPAAGLFPFVTGERGQTGANQPQTGGFGTTPEVGGAAMGDLVSFARVSVPTLGHVQLEGEWALNPGYAVRVQCLQLSTGLARVFFQGRYWDDVGRPAVP